MTNTATAFKGTFTWLPASLLVLMDYLLDLKRAVIWTGGLNYSF